MVEYRRRGTASLLKRSTAPMRLAQPSPALLGRLGTERIDVERTRLIAFPAAAQLRFRVLM